LPDLRLRKLAERLRFRRKGVERTVSVSGNLQGNNGDILVNAAIEGLGVVLQPTFCCPRAAAEAAAAHPPDWEADELSVYAVYPTASPAPKVRSFIDFLAERFGPERIGISMERSSDGANGPRRTVPIASSG